VNRKSDALLFAKNFLKYPRNVGAIIPSSSYLIRTLLAQIDWPRTRVIVEYGPGIGNITREILRRMPPACTLVAIETNEDFVQILRASLPDPRLQVVRGSAAHVRHILKMRHLPCADYIVSSLPFTIMPETLRAEILLQTAAALHPDGSFSAYQYTPAMMSEFEPVFGQIERAFELLNIPPAMVFHCSR
jgi:phospholipid N-methyltransferase